MPSTPTDVPDSTRSADAVLWRGLVADAAVFPPAALALGDAVRAHRAHRAAVYAPAVGPFLVAASAVADLLRVLDAEGAEDDGAEDEHADVLDVVLVARPGADPATLGAARDALRDDPRAQVVGAELGWYEGWSEQWAGELPVAVECPRGPEGDLAFAQTRTAHRDGFDVALKFRTGPTPTWPWPDEDELAAFLRLVAREVAFRLTGCLHHAVRGSYEVGGVPEENHGLLNVLLATSTALAGAGHEEVAGILALRDVLALADVVGAWTDETAREVRSAFTGYGCCTVTDPLGELADLGLLDPP